LIASSFTFICNSKGIFFTELIFLAARGPSISCMRSSGIHHCAGGSICPNSLLETVPKALFSFLKA
jgi:hypothetical protein